MMTYSPKLCDRERKFPDATIKARSGTWISPDSPISRKWPIRTKDPPAGLFWLWVLSWILISVSCSTPTPDS